TGVGDDRDDDGSLRQEHLSERGLAELPPDGRVADDHELLRLRVAGRGGAQPGLEDGSDDLLRDVVIREAATHPPPPDDLGELHDVALPQPVGGYLPGSRLTSGR